MPRVRTLPLLALVLGACLLLPACPGGDGGSDSGWTRWTDGTNETMTQIRSAPARRWEQLVRRIPRSRIYHMDQQAPAEGVVALVTVQPRWGQPPRSRTVGLVTEFRLEGERYLRRQWTAPAGAQVWHAVFALPAPPEMAATALTD
jgi:hypothetical protein